MDHSSPTVTSTTVAVPAIPAILTIPPPIPPVAAPVADRKVVHQLHCPACRRRIFDCSDFALATGGAIEHKCGRCGALLRVTAGPAAQPSIAILLRG